MAMHRRQSINLANLSKVHERHNFCVTKRLRAIVFACTSVSVHFPSQTSHHHAWASNGFLTQITFIGIPPPLHPSQLHSKYPFQQLMYEVSQILLFCIGT